MTNSSKTWLMMLVVAVAALVGEGVTVAVFGYPMSHAMADAPEIAGLLFAFFSGLLLAHWRWPGKARWVLQDKAIEANGRPDSRVPPEVFRRALWEIHTGKPWEKAGRGGRQSLAEEQIIEISEDGVVHGPEELLAAIPRKDTDNA